MIAGSELSSAWNGSFLVNQFASTNTFASEGWFKKKKDKIVKETGMHQAATSQMATRFNNAER